MNTQKIDRILQEAFRHNASDIHLTIGIPPVFRIHGDLRKVNAEVIRPEDTEQMAQSIIADTMWETFKRKGELDFSYGIAGIGRFRVNAFHQRGAISLAFRTIPTTIPTMEELSLPPILKDIAQKPQGLVLVTGPTGSGKSTTLASMLNYVNRHHKKHIITLEDPIEYLHKHQLSVIDQREIGFDTTNFASGLRSALRQDPDIILLGEMRDLETIHTAITAAETGHLVLATLHTSSAASTIERIIDVFPPQQQAQIRIQLSSVLQAVIAQRLFPLHEEKGRVAALEIMIQNPAIANLIRSEKVYQINSVIQTSALSGMQLMSTAVKRLLDQKLISKEQALPYIEEGER